jgi:hypothetical protein
LYGAVHYFHYPDSADTQGQPIQPFQWLGNPSAVAVYGIFALGKPQRNVRCLFDNFVPVIFISLPMACGEYL